MGLWLFFFALFFVIILIAALISHHSSNRHTDIHKDTNELPSGGSRWLSEKESRAPKEKQKRASMRAKKSMSTNLPSEFYRGTLMPKNRIFCPRCGRGYKIYALYGGDNARYGCNWCGKVFT